ncbi:putative ATP-grasp superfamily ATP-dependent carboligase [Paraburkholderia sp. HC6.4b]|uniref:ATP-grasp domain-containing protein n=1 Tax=unclassified Paraburkholderia TaxID=2615204 RepID=UPI001612E6B2|nr:MULTISPECIES: ATP-grasp domain-containing protein [unclassified Paraburkholderia]MBB5413116.1 putative ATP-grasp superfamily ATP-dependent carboligase [Paraburkholderia sp. HC6.4b]MBB5450293.1 putative ATP-grasp superfamily ATP-dependent carboligase [Paraburkholderia sp. Kb1A]
MTRIFVYEYLTGGGIDPQLAGPGSLADLSALIVEGRVMRDALVDALRELDGVQVTFATSRFETPGAGEAHCMAAPGESMTAFVARAAREHDYAWVVAPECDGLLLRFHDAVGTARWLGCAKEAIRVASSKSATAACLAAHGIATTPALEPGGSAAQHDGRWVVKPDDGAGGLDTIVYERFADACAEYEARAAAARNPVLQAWVDGEPLSLSLICRGDATKLLSINRQQIGLSGDDASGDVARIVEFDGVLVDQIDQHSDMGRALDTLAHRVARAIPGLRGFVGIDVVWHPQLGPVVIEVNPRLTVAYAGLSAARGSGLTRALLAAHGVRIERCGAARANSATYEVRP